MPVGESDSALVKSEPAAAPPRKGQIHGEAEGSGRGAMMVVVRGLVYRVTSGGR